MRQLLPLAFATACLAARGARGQPAETLYHVLRETYGCANPRATLALTNLADPRRQDPGWVTFVVNDGHCAPVTPRSPWRLVFRQGELAYMTYAGTTGLPGSFYLRADELSQLPPSPLQVPSQPSPPGEDLPPATDARRPAAGPPVPVQPPRQAAGSETVRLPNPLPENGHVDAPAGAARPPPIPAPVSGPTRPDPAAARRALPGGGDIGAPEARTGAPVAAAPPEAPVPGAASQSSTVTSTGSGGGNGGSGGTAVTVLLAGLGLFALAGRRRRAAVKRARAEPRAAVPPSRPAARTVPATPATGRPPSRGISTPGRWLPKGEAATVAGKVLPGGMIYVGSARPGTQGVPPCLLDPSLEVARRDPESSGAGMPYWPSYAGITPRHRLAYLEWLAGGRSDPRACIGYVFIFFYGLERRLFVDGTDAAETSDIVGEVRRLRGVYGSNSSFAGYSQGLLYAVEALAAYGRGGQATFVPDLASPAHLMPLPLKLAIATKVAAAQPLPFELAAAGMIGLPSDELPIDRMVLEHARPQFLSMLRARFEAACPAGFNLQNRKDSQLWPVHRCATSGLSVDLAAGRPPLPDPATLTWTRLVKMALPIAAQLGPFAKRAAARPGWTGSLEAMSLLPQEAWAAAASGHARQASEWLSGLPKPLADVPFSDIALHVLGEPGASRTPRRHEKACQALAALAHGLEPQAGEATGHEQPLVLFPDLDARAARSPAFRAAAAGAQIASAVARLDPAARARVEDVWVAAISRRLSVTPSERLRLAARLRWSGGIPTSAARVRRGLAEASGAEREAVAWAAAFAASSAGLVATEQVGVLEKVYDGLGLPRQDLYSTIHAAGAARAASLAVPARDTAAAGTNAYRPASAPDHRVPAASTRKGPLPNPGRPLEAAPAFPDPKLVARAGDGAAATGPETVPAVPASPADEPVLVAKGTAEVIHSIPAPRRPSDGPDSAPQVLPRAPSSFGPPAQPRPAPPGDRQGRPNPAGDDPGAATILPPAHVRPGTSTPARIALDEERLRQVRLDAETVRVLLEGAPADDAEDAKSVAAEAGPRGAGGLHPGSAAPDGAAPAMAIDAERLRRIRAETERVSALLAGVFAEEEETQPAPAPVDPGTGAFPGLDAVHAKLAETMLASATWARADFDRLAIACGLMPDGALETINEWAYETIGEPLIDDGEPLTVHADLLGPEGRADAA